MLDSIEMIRHRVALSGKLNLIVIYSICPCRSCETLCNSGWSMIGITRTATLLILIRKFVMTLNGGTIVSKIQVVGAIILNNHQLLAAKRAADRTLGGYWEFPGGKIEPGEAPKVAVQRELAEEFGAQATVFDKFDIDGDAELTFGEVVLHCYCVRLDSKITKTIAHDELRWVTPQEALGLPWAPSDVAVIEALAKTGFDDEY